MTNEEAIEIIKQDIPCEHDTDLIEALDVAIKALEQQPCEDMPCISAEEMQKCKDIVKKYTSKQYLSDTVSRGAFEQVMWERDVAIGQLKELGYGLGQKVEACDDAVSREAVIEILENYGCTNREGLIFKDIQALPPVTPQQKYGKWILADEQNKEDVENDNYRFICSECQCSDIHAKGAIVPYCWKCGAKMQESEEV